MEKFVSQASLFPSDIALLFTCLFGTLPCFFKLEINRFVVAHDFDVMRWIGEKRRIDKQGFLSDHESGKHTGHFGYYHILQFEFRHLFLKQKRYCRSGVLFLCVVIVKFRDVPLGNQMKQEWRNECKETGESTYGNNHRGSTDFAGLLQQYWLRDNASQTGSQGKHFYHPDLRRQYAVIHFETVTVRSAVRHFGAQASERSNGCSKTTAAAGNHLRQTVSRSQ